MRVEQPHRAGYDRQGNGRKSHQEVSPRRPFQEPVGQKRPQADSEQACKQGHPADPVVRVRDRHSADRLVEIRGPGRQRTRGEGDCRHAERVVEERRRAEQVEVFAQGRAGELAGHRLPFGRPPSRIMDQKARERRGQSGNADDEERDPPVPPVGDASANHVTEPAAQRQRQEVEPHHAPAVLRGEQVREQRRRDHTVGRLADAQKCPPEEHVGETAGKRRPDRRQAPDSDA